MSHFRYIELSVGFRATELSLATAPVRVAGFQFLRLPAAYLCHLYSEYIGAVNDLPLQEKQLIDEIR